MVSRLQRDRSFQCMGRRILRGISWRRHSYSRDRDAVYIFVTVLAIATLLAQLSSTIVNYAQL